MWIPEKGSPMVEMFREAAGTNTEKVAAEFPARPGCSSWSELNFDVN